MSSDGKVVDFNSLEEKNLFEAQTRLISNHVISNKLIEKGIIISITTKKRAIISSENVDLEYLEDTLEYVLEQIRKSKK